VQASYSQPEGGLFFTEKFTTCDVLPQILKSEPAYFFLHRSENFVKKLETFRLFFQARSAGTIVL
jgi:hypothetical protein